MTTTHQSSRHSRRTRRGARTNNPHKRPRDGGKLGILTLSLHAGVPTPTHTTKKQPTHSSSVYSTSIPTYAQKHGTCKAVKYISSHLGGLERYKELGRVDFRNHKRRNVSGRFFLATPSARQQTAAATLAQAERGESHLEKCMRNSRGTGGGGWEGVETIPRRQGQFCHIRSQNCQATLTNLPLLQRNVRHELAPAHQWADTTQNASSATDGNRKKLNN